MVLHRCEGGNTGHMLPLESINSAIGHMVLLEHIHNDIGHMVPLYISIVNISVMTWVIWCHLEAYIET